MTEKRKTYSDTFKQQRDERSADDFLPSISSFKRDQSFPSDSTYETSSETAEVPHQGPLREPNRDLKIGQYRGINIESKAPHLVIQKSARSANNVKPRVQRRQALKQAWTRDHGSRPQVGRDRCTKVHGSSETPSMIS
jgi:hypothetical protein